MGNFNRGSNRSGGSFNRRSGGGHRFGGRDGGSRPMHKATCSECGESCELPFRPTGDRPVYCSNCFEKQGGGRSSSFGGERRSRPRFEDRGGSGSKDSGEVMKQIKLLSDKIDNLAKMLMANSSLEKTKKPEVKEEKTKKEVKEKVAKKIVAKKIAKKKK